MKLRPEESSNTSSSKIYFGKVLLLLSAKGNRLHKWPANDIVSDSTAEPMCNFWNMDLNISLYGNQNQVWINEKFSQNTWVTAVLRGNILTKSFTTYSTNGKNTTQVCRYFQFLYVLLLRRNAQAINKMNSWKSSHVSYLNWESIVREEKKCAFLNNFKISRSLLGINMLLEFQAMMPVRKLVCSGSTF